ncbi:MAG: PAS domain S-box protein [Chloroflexota bacterium]
MTSKAQLFDELKAARQQISSLEKNLGEALGVVQNQPTKEILPIVGAFETSSHGIVIIQPQAGLIFRCNPAFTRLVGRKLQDVIGLPFLNLTVAGDHPQVIQTISELNNQENTGCEAYFIHKAGTIFPAQVDFSGIRDADGNILYCVATLQDITNRKKTDLALKTSEENFKRAQAVAHVGSWIYQLDNYAVEWSDETYGIFDFPVGKKVTEQEFFDRIYPNDLERVIVSWNAALDGEPFDIEYCIIVRNGQIRWVREVAELIYSDTDEAIYAVGTVQDITEKKQTDLALRASEERYRVLLGSLDSVVATVNYDGQFLYVNDVVARDFGCRVDDVVGKTMGAFFPEPGASRQIANIRKVIQENKGLVTESQNYVKGELRWFHTSIQPIHDETGRAIFALVNSTDINDLKMAQQGLIELNQTLEKRVRDRTREVQDLYDKAPCGYHSLNSEGKFIRINLTILNWLGYSEQELLGKSFECIISPEYVKVFREEFHQFKKNGVAKDLEYELIGKNGNILPVTLSAVAVFDADGHYVSSRGTMFDISRRKLAEQELRRREELYRALFSNSNDGILLVSPDDGQLQANPKALEMLGYTFSEGDTLNIKQIFSTDEYEDERKKISVALSGEKVPLYERILVTRPGIKLNVEINLSAILDTNGKIILIQSVIRDITERKNTEEKMRFQSKLLDVVGQAVIVTDMHGKISFWNRAAENLYGWKEAEVLGKTVYEAVVAETSQEQAHEIMQELSSGKMWSGEFMVRKRDGTIFWSQVTDTPIYSADGQLMVGLIGVSMDISERKNVEISLRESEGHNRLLFEESPDAITLTDFDGRIIRTNRAYEQLTKILLEKMIGKTSEELGIISSETSAILKNRIAQAISLEDQFVALEYHLFCADGSVRNVESRVFPLKYAGLDQILMTSRDISIRTQAEEILRLANVELERALRLKSEFLANMSHELRTPLNAILGISESLTEQVIGPLNEKQLRYIGVIYESGRHLLDLINDILDLSKVEAGRISLDLQIFDVKSVCEASFRLVKELASKKQQEFSFEMDNSTKMIRADERRLKQMLVNLLSNAVKFTHVGGKFGLVVEDDPATESILFTVWDNGIGIKPGDLGHIFEPFIQLDAGLVREQPGTGLGLALVAEMARLHGGSVSVDSSPGLGSRFKIFLPMVGGKTGNDQLCDPKITSQTTKILSGVDSQQTILIIEDIETISMALKEYLLSAGFRVSIASDGMEGVFQVRNLQPDLVLMDIEMPIMDGFEVANLIRSEPDLRHIPIVAMTALAMPTVQEQCRAAGMAEYISKPVILKDVLILIRRLLDAADVRGI